ncbi:MAG: chemotaxis response regulator protein-glutamate methylesterase [Leptospiraceae bacterium]|nr:chemotaxis response regulator protein-glutamate methylesterase [Leptospiraceae bacterium]
MTPQKIKVFIIDDSALVRQVVTEILSEDPTIEVMGTASDPIFAQKYLEKDWPDVIILDLEMPRMDGLTFLHKIMQEHPTPVVICSSLTKEGTSHAMAALEAGAVGIITKPEIGLKDFLSESKTTLIDAVKSAAQAKIAQKRQMTPKTKLFDERPKLSADAILPPPTRTTASSQQAVVAIGASTGGTVAIEDILTKLPAQSPPILIVQHMPAGFTKAFAERLNELCAIEVKEAEDGDLLRWGRALIAPGNFHLLMEKRGQNYVAAVKSGPLVNRHRPSVDVLFRSVAQNAAKNSLGILLTGMGDDGAQGMVEMHEKGMLCLAQDEKSSVVFGMPREAIIRGAVDKVLPLDKIAQEIINHFASHQKS